MKLVPVAAISAAGVTAIAPRADVLVAALGGPDFPDAVLALVSLALLAVAAWALLVVALASVPQLRWIAVGITPRVLHTVVLAGVVGTVAVGPAHADTPGPTLDGLRLPDRPVVAARRPPVSDAVVVLPGDTLWGIAAVHLDARADATTIARSTARWYAANRRVIGPDPDLIHPGQRLAPPQENPS